MIQIGTDNEGWPVDALNVQNILLKLGFTYADGKLSIEQDAEILKAYPRLLEDDGIGYGIDNGFITEVEPEIYEKDIKVIDFIVGTDPKLNINKFVDDAKIKAFNLWIREPDNKPEEEE